MEEQLKEWRGDFGAAYTDRNVVDWHTRVDAFSHIVGDRNIESAAEIGCNRGHNLHVLQHILGQQSTLVGVEPQAYARTIANRELTDVNVLDGTIYDIPLSDRSQDLVLTCGVLIHVPLESIDTALREVHRVARKYILSIEYFAEDETTIEYRGHDNLLWKRDFGAHYQRLFPNLVLEGSGDLTAAEGFDRARWWLFACEAA